MLKKVRINTLHTLAIICGFLSCGTNKEPKSIQTEASTSMVSILDAVAESAKDMTIVTIRLKGNPAQTPKIPIEEHGTFLQIPLTKVTTLKSGSFYDGSGPFVKKVAIFQLSETDSAVRLFLNEEASAVLAATEAELFSDRLIITIDHKSIVNKFKTLPESPSLQATNLQEPANNLQEPASNLPDNPKSSSATLIPKPSLNDYLTRVSIFSAVLIVGMSLLVMMRSLNRKRGRTGNHQSIEMRKLGTLPLAARQHLSLVRVGEETILLAVSPDGVRLITHIQPHEMQQARHQPHPQLTLSNTAPQVNTGATTLQAGPQIENQGRRAYQKQILASVEQKPQVSHPTTNTRPQKSIETKAPSPKLQESKPKKPELPKNENKNAIEDVTALIREKLKNLPPL